MFSGTDGRVDMKLICGTIAAEEKGRAGKDDKVILWFIFFFFLKKKEEKEQENFIYVIISNLGFHDNVLACESGL